MTTKESVISHLRQSALSIVELTRPSRYIRFLLRMSETYRQTNNCQHCFRAHRMHRINVVICHTCFTLRGLCVRVLGTPVSPAKRVNRSRCHSRIDSRLVWTYGNCNRWECTLALSGEYDWTTRVRRRCKKTMQPHQRTSPRRQISVNTYTCKQYRIHLQSIIITINQSLKLSIRLITECICVNSSSSASTPNTVDALRFVHSTWTKLNWIELQF